MNKDDTLQAIVDHYELSDFNGCTTEALSDAFKAGEENIQGYIRLIMMYNIKSLEECGIYLNSILNLRDYEK